MTLSLISPLFYLISLSLHLLLYLHCAGIFNLSFNLYFIFCFTFLCFFHLLFTFLLALFTLSSPTNFLPHMTASFLFHLLYCFFFVRCTFFFLMNTPDFNLAFAFHCHFSIFVLFDLSSSAFSSRPLIVPIQAGVITGAIIGVVLGLLVLIVVIYYLMRFLVARRVFSLSVRSVPGLWPAALCQSGFCQGLELKPEPIPGMDTCVAKLA